MKFVIDIPDREFKGEIADHFQDFFMRLQAEIQHRLSSNDTLVCGNYELETVEMLLKSFKNATIDQEPRWIPVSERLPKPYTYVNATCRSLVDDRADWVVETFYLPIPKENNERGYSDWGDIPMLIWHKAEVVAWMEHKIPEPYKGKEEEE